MKILVTGGTGFGGSHLVDALIGYAGGLKMQGLELKIKVNEFLAHRVKEMIKSGVFKNEEDFLKNAIKEMVRKYEVQELNIRMDEFARKMAKKHPKSLSEMVLAVRTEENESL
ncbi:MAG: hypothetical protein L6416_11465 [Candidatus Omnitrophica bacterium]|nr:hypothetical protein [Euryarchaeota archaeon]MCG2712922.1 hypothetical protein [Candidatus Omnitrophota bacterium]